MADGLFYVDSRGPHIAADLAAITVLATNVPLIPTANLPVLGSNYWSFVGKAVRIRMFGRFTGAAAAGTQTFSLWWGPNTASATVNIGTSAAITMTNSATNVSWMWEMVVRCRAVGAGTSGSLLTTGFMQFGLGAVALQQPILIPATAPAPFGVDTTAASLLSPQVLATTSVTNTMQVHDFLFEALN